MKQRFIIFALTFLSLGVFAQENWITVNGGYAFAKVDDTDINLSGWRINLAFERNAYEGKMVHGLVVGYITTEGSLETGVGNATVDYKLTSFPIYYMPKVLFGSGDFKGFAKGAVGLHISDFSQTGILFDVTDDSVAFYLGLGAGAMYSLGKLFISFDYELAFAANSYYNNGFINSAMLGIGIKF
jgi:hypothetical protein